MTRIIKMVDLYERQLTKSQDERHNFYYSQLDQVLDQLFEIAVLRDMSWKELATASGLSYQTVVNLGERWTKRPQFRTVLLIADAVDCQIITSKRKKTKTRLKIAS